MVWDVRGMEMKLKLCENIVVFLLWYAAKGWVSTCSFSKCLGCENNWVIGWEF